MDTFREESVRRTGMSWSAVFAGTFVFLSIEATFGALAVALIATLTQELANGPVR